LKPTLKDFCKFKGYEIYKVYADEGISTKNDKRPAYQEIMRNVKDNVVDEITAYHQLNYYKDSDLHDIADGTSREEEINDYIYEQNYGTDKDYEDYDIDI